MPPLLIAALIQGGMAAAGKIIDNINASESEKAQANNIRTQLAALNSYETSSLERLQAIYDSAGGKVKAAMETQTQAALDEMNTDYDKSLSDLAAQMKGIETGLDRQAADQKDTYLKAIEGYRENLDKNRQTISNSFKNARMGVSGAFIAAMNESQAEQGKQETKMVGEQAKYMTQIGQALTAAGEEFARNRTNMALGHESNVSTTRINAGASIMQALAGLETQRAQQEMALRGDVQGARMNMTSKADALDSSVNQRGGFGSFLSAAFTGLSAAAPSMTSFFSGDPQSPKETKKDTPVADDYASFNPTALNNNLLFPSMNTRFVSSEPDTPPPYTDPRWAQQNLNTNLRLGR